MEEEEEEEDDEDVEDLNVKRKPSRRQRGKSVEKEASEESEDDNGEQEEKKENKTEVTEEEKPKKRGRGRPPGRKNKVNLLTSSVYEIGTVPTHRFINSEADLHEDDSKTRTENGNRRILKVKKVNNSPFPVPVDDNGDFIPLVEEEDEYITEDDPKGDEKIDRNGNLKGGRDFRVRTFTVTGKGDKLYMLLTEPARCLGYRDAYYLFLKHPLLYKFILSSEEKADLVERKILPNLYKSRTIGLVTARSIFKEFGPRIIIGGRKVIDDYYEDAAREVGDAEGELAVPDDIVPENKADYNKKRYIAWYGGSQIHQQQNAQQISSPGPNGSGLSSNSVNKYIGFPMHKEFKLKSALTDDIINEKNWVSEHAVALLNYNSTLTAKRLNTQDNGYGQADFFTGLYFVPNNTQPTKGTWIKEIKKEEGWSIPQVNYSNWAGLNGDVTCHSDGLVYKAVFKSSSLIHRTGLLGVERHIFEDCVDKEVRDAILKQQEAEGSL